MILQREHLNSKLGTVVILDDGILFILNISSKELSFPDGDSAAIGATGIFGAYNLYRKMESEDKNNNNPISDIAEDDLKALVQQKEAKFFPWREINRIKKAMLSGVITIFLEGENKITLSNPGREDAYELIRKRIH